MKTKALPLQPGGIVRLLTLFALLLTLAAVVLPAPAAEESAAAASARAEDTALDGPLESLRPAPRHKRVVQVVTELMQRYHYEGTEIDDALSGQVLAGYIDALDGNKFYFLADDIKRFEKYRNTLDDAVRAGNVAPAFDIFNLYRERVQERILYAIALLDTEPDFSVDEEYVFDRDGLPWASSKDELDEVWRKRVKNDALSLVLTGKEWDGDDGVAGTLTERYQRVLRRTRQLNADEVFESFMNAYADTLDPHSNYFSPRNTEEYRIQMSLSYVGIGGSVLVG
jgi:carboxyl-terminal processing protease